MALMDFAASADQNPLSRHINLAVTRAVVYLNSRHDQTSGAFGLLSRPDSAGNRHLIPHLRHSIWALVAFQKLQASGFGLDLSLHRGWEFVAHNLVEFPFEKESLGVTLAAIHRLLEDQVAARLLMLTERGARENLLHRTEEGLQRVFDPSVATYMPYCSDVASQGIDVALLVLRIINPESLITERCRRDYQAALDHILQKHLQEVEPGVLGLPMKHDEPPDIGASLHLLWILQKNRGFMNPDKAIMKGLVAFVTAPQSRRDYAQHAYSWHLTAALRLASR